MRDDVDRRQLAVLLIDLHGARAPDEAKHRASRALAQGDLRGHAMWSAVLEYCRLPLSVLMHERVH